ncbi:MAG: cation:proton antiporter [Chloroflexi bacterium]|nr:cation:proton antiporter [Chloroflexota bacterium]MDA1240752.1 cation:proton antiporter [Chloroflexota bacterium]
MEHDLLIEFTALLLLAAAAGAIGTLLRQPLIVAFIAVGIAAGPAGLDVISDSDAWELLSAVGISLLLFVVGLRLDTDEIRATGIVALITGLGQVAFTSIVGFFITIALGFGVTASIYVAIALTFSSTIIIVKLLSDKREIESLHGRIAVGFLIVQDIVVVLVMIGISAFAGTGAEDISPVGEAFEIAGKGAAYLGAIFLAMKFAIPTVFRTFAKVPELLVLGAIAWAMALSVGGEELGFSREVGAFLAGISLASTPFRDALGGRLMSLRDFLLVFFFVVLGAGLDLSLLGAQLWPAVLLSLFVLIGNPLIVMIIMGVMGYRKRTGFLSGLAVAQISEFSLILGALGVSVGHIDSETLGLITLVGIVTITLSTYLIIYSHQIYDRIQHMLSIFERSSPYREEGTADMSESVDFMVIGLGRFGGEIARQLLDQGYRVAGMDFDPEVIRVWRRRGLVIHYGDVEDPEMGALVPTGTGWVVSTLPQLELSEDLMRTLHARGFPGKVALTAHTTAAAEWLTHAGADMVLLPFHDAATQVVTYLTHPEVPHSDFSAVLGTDEELTR